MSSNNRIFIQYLSQIILGFQRLLLPEWVKQGATVESIEMEFFQNTLFPLPSIEEQKAIVSHIQNETTQLDALRSATERTITLLKERRSALIGAAVTGQIEITKSWYSRRKVVLKLHRAEGLIGPPGLPGAVGNYAA